MFPYGEIIEALCLVAALFFLRGEKGVLWLSLRFYLLFVLLVELAGVAMARNKIPNGWLYNLSLPIMTLFPGYLLFVHLKGSNLRKAFLGLAALFLVIWLIGLWNQTRDYSYFTDLTGSVFLLVLTGAFYFELLKADDYLELGRYPAYWLAAGILLFNCGSIVCGIFAYTMGRLYVNGLPLWNLLLTILTFIQCVCWVNAFRWQHYRASN